MLGRCHPASTFGWRLPLSGTITAGIIRVTNGPDVRVVHSRLTTPQNWIQLQNSAQAGRDATFYQSKVGVLRWIVELGRGEDINTEVSELAPFLTMPRRGHLEAIFHVFNYLEKKQNAWIVFDPGYADVDMSAFKECN